MEARFVQTGEQIDYTPGAETSGGTVIVQNEMVGVTNRDIEANELGALAITGVFEFAKTTGVGTAISTGQIVYWDDTNKVATTNDASGTNKRIGMVVADAIDDDDVVRAMLSS